MSQKETKKKEVDVVTCPNRDQVRVHIIDILVDTDEQYIAIY